MFDIAFSEILVIAVVALVVIGPERLPKTARTLGHLFGRLQRYVSEVKADITREMELDELRRLREEVQTAAREIETSVHSAATEVQSSVRSVEAQLNDAANLADAPAASADVGHPPQLTNASSPARDLISGPLGISPSPSSSAAIPEEPPRQADLPGLERP
ncbi:MAG: Sec-independent protein translocase protein TatB [Pseudomonadota bacterium]|nr:Sec-independent protein translocase protein TatB [Pseudomonadota bacterium]